MKLFLNWKKAFTLWLEKMSLSRKFCRKSKVQTEHVRSGHVPGASKRGSIHLKGHLWLIDNTAIIHSCLGKTERSHGQNLYPPFCSCRSRGRMGSKNGSGKGFFPCPAGPALPQGGRDGSLPPGPASLSKGGMGLGTTTPMLCRAQVDWEEPFFYWVDPAWGWEVISPLWEIPEDLMAHLPLPRSSFNAQTTPQCCVGYLCLIIKCWWVSLNWMQRLCEGLLYPTCYWQQAFGCFNQQTGDPNMNI